MTTQIIAQTKQVKDQSQVIIVNNVKELSKWSLSKEEQAYIGKKIASKENYIVLNQFNRLTFIQITADWDKKSEAEQLENYRHLGNKICSSINVHQYKSICINPCTKEDYSLAMAEGIALSNYQFLKYKSDKSQANTLEKIALIGVKTASIASLNILVNAVYKARTWVNEPQSYLTAVSFSKEIKAMATDAGVSCEILNKKQIESLKMGGLLAVNQGSKTPPTFTILEYKPKLAKNKKPLVLVGKGVVYDTGGLSLKPTPNSMDTMKCDMAGGAAVAAAICAIAKAKLAYHIIALIPATDNRPGENAYTPGDVVSMYDGQTVEVLNTDAEGRMLLGDALAYAKKYKPSLVLDFATLTGAAAAAIGSFGTVFMGTASDDTKRTLIETGNLTHERLVEFPFWDDYAKLIKSDLADMKNIGGPIGGAITAGKFLEKFTDYPWMHFDIAGPAYLNSPDSYRGKNGTGVGVRLIFNFVKKLSE
jgi:leucyl aminopeptidase